MGANKARFFRAATGFDESTSDELIRQLHEGVRQQPAELGLLDEYGQRFRVDIPVHGASRDAVVRTGWIVDPGTNVPCLVTAYVKVKEERWWNSSTRSYSTSISLATG